QYLNKEKGEIFLVKNEIKFAKQANKKVKKKSSLTEQLSQRYLQRPNRKFFFVPRQYFYYDALDTLGRNKLGHAWLKAQMNILAEKPVFLDTVLAEKTAESMKIHLQNRGYFLADVEHGISINKKKTKARVTYTVQPGGRFLIDTLRYESKDTAILRIVNSIAKKSSLKPGKPVDIELYNQEVKRITGYLVNHGYADFYPQYINSLEATDSSNLELSADLVMEILVPRGKAAHTSYTIGDIYVYPNFDPTQQHLAKPDTLINGIYFSSGGKKFEVKPKTLISSIALKKGDVYRFDDVEATRRQLGTLGVFATPTIRRELSESDSTALDFYIQLTSNPKREFSTDFDISYTTRNGVGFNPNLVGFTVSPSISNRNFLKGAELLNISLDLGVELASVKEINSRDFRIQTDLYFPRFVDIPLIWRGLRGIGLTSHSFYDKLKKKGISRFSGSFNSLKLLGNYNLITLNGSFGHSLKLSPTKSLSINHIGIDWLTPNIESGSPFEMLLENQPFLERSFSSQLSTGFLFRDVSFVYAGSSRGRSSYWYFKTYFDLSGIEAMSLNSLGNAISGNSKKWDKFSHYYKLELDARRYWKFGGNRVLVARLSSGIARPFYSSSDVPYVKQFFVGGQLSNRGWNARGIGPGIFRDPFSQGGSNNGLLYQAADMKIEFNLEYRFKVMRPLGFFDLNMAVFLDGANIWTINKDDSRVGSQFALKRVFGEDNKTIVQDNFVRTMAIGTGLGFRIDVSYFILLFDFGTPLKNNYPDPKRGNTYWADFSGWGRKDIVWHIGLGYPF
ncbi:MAG TPA: hypothetical protein ENJ95_11140, partial [Bacteroidetes bacterium]|nr:hypothetical protein [Bacteroidota bacterium]